MIGLLSMLGVAQGGVSVVAFAVLLLVCAIVGLFLLRRSQSPARAAWALSGLATVAALAFTLWPNTGIATAGCSVEFSWTAPFEVQNLANIALLIPATFFATVASRRPAPAAAAGTGLSAAIELTQALLPALNRACDTQDWQMNTTGAILGAAIGWWTTRLATRTPTRTATPVESSRTQRAATWIWTATATTAIATWFTICALNPIPSDPCDEHPAGAPTALPGNVTVQAGSQTGHLCIHGPHGETAGLGDDPPPGVIETFGTGKNQWAIGVAPSGALTAHDDRETSARTHPVQGSKLRVWSTYRPTT